MAGSHRWEDRKDRDENKEISELHGVDAPLSVVELGRISGYKKARESGNQKLMAYFAEKLIQYHDYTMEKVNALADAMGRSNEDLIETLIELALDTHEPEKLQFAERLAKPYESKSYWRLTRTVSKRTGLRAHVLAIKWLDNNLFVAFATGGKIGSGGGFPVYRYSGVTSAQHKYLLKQEANPGKWVHRMLGEADEYIGQVSISEVKADDVISQTQELQSRADEAKRNRG